MVAGGLAREAGYRLFALSIDYNQRHRLELQAAGRVATALHAISHIVLPLDLTAFGGSALTAAIAVPKGGAGAGIRRASRRARVCQYVKISVVAVSLTKTQDVHSIPIPHKKN